jgi:hypothetical protein
MARHKAAAQAHKAAAAAAEAMQPGPDGQPGSTTWPHNAARPSGAEETGVPGGEVAAVLGAGASGQETTLTHEQALAAYFSFFGSEVEGECKDQVPPR